MIQNMIETTEVTTAAETVGTAEAAEYRVGGMFSSELRLSEKEACITDRKQALGGAFYIRRLHDRPGNLFQLGIESLKKCIMGRFKEKLIAFLGGRCFNIGTGLRQKQP